MNGHMLPRKVLTVGDTFKTGDLDLIEPFITGDLDLLPRNVSIVLETFNDGDFSLPLIY